MKKLDPFWVEAPAAKLESKGWMRFSAYDSLACGLWTIHLISLWYTVLSKNGCSTISGPTGSLILSRDRVSDPFLWTGWACATLLTNRVMVEVMLCDFLG